MPNTERQFQQQVQIELQARQYDPSPAASPPPRKTSDTSVLIQSDAPRSDEFSLSLPQSNGYNKPVEDGCPLLVLGGDFPSPQEHGSIRHLPLEIRNSHPPGEASLRSAVFNLSTTIVGAGIMALPATMRVLGMLPGLAMIILMGVFSQLSVEMVVRYTSRLKKWTFGGMVQEALGKRWGLASQIALVINNAGILIVYMIIMGDVMSGSTNHTGLFELWSGARGWWTHRSLVLFLTMILVLAPLSSLKRIDSLELSSALSVALAMVFVVLSTGITFVNMWEGQLATPRMWPSFDPFVDLLTVIPIMTNSFVCQFNVPPIYSELRERTEDTMNKVGRLSIGLCVAMYTATALSGYLLFGDLTDSDVLNNFDTDLGIANSRAWNSIIRVGYVVHLFFVFPVINFSLRDAVDSLLFPKAAALTESNLRFGLLTSVLLTIIYGGSTLIPNIWVAFKFTGATTALALGFMFPALVALKLRGGDMEEKLALTLLVMAVVVSFAGVSTQIYSYAT